MFYIIFARNPSNEEGQRSGQVSELKLNRPNEWILLGSALTQSEKVNSEDIFLNT